jgi:hypothetical protein
MRRFCRIDRDAGHPADDVDTIGPIGLTIRNVRRSERLPQQRRPRSRASGRRPTQLRECNRGLGECRGEGPRRWRSTRPPRSRWLGDRRSACAGRQTELRAHRPVHGDCRHDIVIDRGIARTEVMEEALERLAARARCGSRTRATRPGPDVDPTSHWASSPLSRAWAASWPSRPVSASGPEGRRAGGGPPQTYAVAPQPSLQEFLVSCRPVA